MINTLFFLAPNFGGVNDILSRHIIFHHSIRKGCSLAPYVYVFTTNDFGYVLENDHVDGQIEGIILLDAFEMVNNHFAGDSLLSL